MEISKVYRKNEGTPEMAWSYADECGRIYKDECSPEEWEALLQRAEATAKALLESIALCRAETAGE